MTLDSNYIQLRHSVTSPFGRLEAVTAVSVCSRHGCQEIGDCGSRDQLGDGDWRQTGHWSQSPPATSGGHPGVRHAHVYWTFIDLFENK